jgi:hypothetical protein
MSFGRNLLSITLSLILALPVNGWGQQVDQTAPSSQEFSAQDAEQLAFDYTQQEEAVASGTTVAPLSIDIFSLLPQKTIDQKEKFKKFYSWNTLTVKMVSEENALVFKQDLAEFSENNVGYGGSFKTCDLNSCRIELSQEDKFQPLNSKTIQQFFLEAKQVAIMGPYILFTSKDGDSTLKMIDLYRYENLIGNDSIPVFEIPVKVDGGIRSLTADNNQIVINNEIKMGIGQIDGLAPIFSAIFNISAHMVDPGAMAGVAPLYASLGEFMERVFKSGAINTTQMDGLPASLVDQEKFLEQLKGKLDLVQGSHKVTKEELLDKSKQGVEAYEKWLQNSEAFKTALKKSQTQVTNARRFWARVRQIFGYISKPLPESSGKIKRAIKIVVGNTLKNSGGVFTNIAEYLNGNRELSDVLSLKQIATSTAVVGAIALSQTLPESYTAFVGDGLLYSKTLLQYFTNSVLYGFWDTHKTSFQQVTSIYTSLQPVYDQYIRPETGQWYKFLIGTGVFTASVGVLLGGYHIPRRLWDLVKDMRGLGYKNLIHRQNRLEERFAKLVSASEAEMAQKKADALKEADPSLADEDHSATKRRLEAAKEDRKNQKSWLGKALARLKKQKTESQQEITQAVVSLEKASQLKEEDVKPIRSYWQAIKHLLFSVASYRATVGEYTSFFNLYASIRYSSFGWSYLPGFQKKFNAQIPIMIKVRPFGIAARMLYPQFFDTVVNKRDGRIVFPTVLNGGMTSLIQKGKEGISHLIKRFTYTPGPEQLELFSQLQDRTPYELKRELEMQKTFEDKIIDTEEQVIAESIKVSLSKLTQFAKSDKDIQWLFTQTGGVKQITSKQIGLLDLRNKVFVRTYMDLIYHEAMKEVLESSVTPLNQEPSYASNQVSAIATSADLKKLKNELLAKAHSAESVRQSLTIPSEKVQEIVKRLSERPDLLAKAQSRAKWSAMGLPSFQVVGNHLKTEIAAALDGSQNPPMRNYEIVRQMKRDEVAMARATRNEIATLFRTLPIDISLKFLTTAGITMGIMKPIQDTFWGDNSVAYLSQYSFYGSLLAGIAFSSVSSAWGKLRQDYYDAQDGLFGDIPQGQDAQKGYWKWFWKKWKSPENKLTKYWKNYINIVFWNIPAAVPQIMLLNYLFLGRFDMDAFVLGYISTFALPFSAFFFKLDQIFEQSAYYAARGLKGKDLADVDVQMWLQTEMQKLRNKFNVKRDLISNPIMEILGNAEVTPTALMGPRALARYLFGGYTPTELVVLKMRDFSDLTGSGIIKKVMDGCEKFLTNGNPDLIKLPKKGG